MSGTHDRIGTLMPTLLAYYYVDAGAVTHAHTLCRIYTKHASASYGPDRILSFDQIFSALVNIRFPHVRSYAVQVHSKPFYPQDGPEHWCGQVQTFFVGLRLKPDVAQSMLEKVSTSGRPGSILDFNHLVLYTERAEKVLRQHKLLRAQPVLWFSPVPQDDCETVLAEDSETEMEVTSN